MALRVVETAAAKVNLFLHIVGRRADGYHDLQSLCVFLDAGERLELAAAEAFSLRVEGPFAAALEGENLALTACERLASRFGGAASIRLHKALPVGAGIGGGSADAAAALRGFAKLRGIEAGLKEEALALGSDVPACLYSRAMWMEGRGERLRPVSLPPLPMVLVNPRLPLATGSMFARIKPPYTEGVALPEGFSGREELMAFLRVLRNDFEPQAVEALPVVGGMLSALRQEGAELARMSGSGATCFGLFDSEEAARAAAKRMERWGWWVACGMAV